MKVSELADRLGLEILSGGDSLAREVTGGYTSDLLSDVMGNLEEGMVWITLQIHRNMIAVASLKEAAAVILIGGSRPDDETIAQAASEGVVLMATAMPSFETSGRIYELIR